MVVRPVSFEFDFAGEFKQILFTITCSNNTLDTDVIDTQFLLGESLIVCPILTPDTNDVECVLPAGSGKWCLYKPYGLDGSDKRAAFNDDWTLEYHQTECFNMLDDDEETIRLSTNTTIALIRAGSIVPMKFPYELDGSGIMTLDQIRDVNPYMIHAVLDKASEASGSVFVDDGKRSG